jgi:hypothetical protein
MGDQTPSSIPKGSDFHGKSFRYQTLPNLRPADEAFPDCDNGVFPVFTKTGRFNKRHTQASHRPRPPMGARLAQGGDLIFS